MSTAAINLGLSHAVAGLQTVQTALSITSNNIANAQVAGYTRKSANLESVLINGQGAGVRVASVTREVNEYLIRDVRLQKTQLGESSVRQEFFAAMQDMFGTPEAGSSLSATITSLANKTEALAIDPSSFEAQLGLVNAANALTTQFNDMERSIQDLRLQADQEISGAIEEINLLLQNVAELNIQISRNTALGLPTGDMEDQRDMAVARLAEHMDISTFTRDNNELVIFMASGRPLVDREASTFSYTPVSGMNGETSYPSGGINGIMLDGVDVTNDFASGRLRGLIDMRDTELPNLAAELNSLATMLKDQINAIHNDGATIPPHSSLTSEISFDTPATTTVNITGTVRLAVLNSDGTAAGPAFDFSLDDLTTFVGGPPTIEQIRNALNGAYEVSVPTLTGLDGATASINADGQLVITANTAGQGIAINEGTSQETTTGFGFSHYFGFNNFFTGSDIGGMASNLAVREDILANPQNLSRGQLSEDALVAGTVALTSGDGSIAQRMADIFQDEMTYSASGGLPTTSATFSGYAASILADNATRAANAEDTYEYRQTLLQDIQNKSDSFSGVNTDEEMSNLIVFQNAYAASARVITTLSDMLKMLIEIV